MKILFTSTPLLGHLLPMVPLIRAARAAGHQVRVATGADLAPAARRHGFPLWALGPTPGQPWAGQLVPMAKAWRPDVVVRESAEVAGGAAAAASGALDVVHGLGPADWAHPVQATPYLDPTPRSLRPVGGTVFPRRLPIRPEVGAVYPGERLPGALRHRPYERTIYLTLGTVLHEPDAWVTALEAVRTLPVNVIGTTGPDVDPAIFGRQPEHVMLSRFVPQALILRQVDAVVCHGGPGTVLGALAEGRPLVTLPLEAEHADADADQLVRTGAGLAVDPEARTPESIRAAIIEVLGDPRFAAAASALQTEIATMPSAERRAADLVALAEGRLPASEPVAQTDVVTAA